jgi:hypothetical protein
MLDRMGSALRIVDTAAQSTETADRYEDLITRASARWQACPDALTRRWTVTYRREWSRPSKQPAERGFMRIFGLYGAYAERQIRLAVRYSF